MRSPFDILEAYEQRSLQHAVQLPGREFAAELWRGVGYRIGNRRLVSDFREVVEIVPMPQVTVVPGAQPWLLGVGNLRGNLFPVIDLKYFLEAIMPVCDRYDINMAIHPDDPAWSVFGLPRGDCQASPVRV